MTEEGIILEADQRHAEIMIKDAGLKNDSKGVVTPGVSGDEINNEGLEGERATKYRAAVARENYLSQDRSDIQYAVKELSRGMSRPTVEHEERLKRLARYLVDKTRVRTLFKYQGEVNEVTTYTDRDSAGCSRTRKSTSGGVIMFGQHVIKTWS